MSVLIKAPFMLSAVLALIPFRLQANHYYGEHAIGWHWYDEKVGQQQAKDPMLEAESKDPIQEIKRTREKLEKALDRALLHPTPIYVKNYIELQNAWSEKASQFANMWQWVLLHHPELDYSVAHPTNQVARGVYLDKINQAQDKAIQTLAKQNGLLFFYRHTCPYCRRFAPILKSFSQQYHLPVVPITLDGISLPEFPQSRIDQGQALRFQVKAVPALFTANPYTHQVAPVFYGLISESDLRQKILTIAQMQRGDR